MRIKIKETGEIKGLSIIDPENGVDWIADLVGSGSETYEYNEENDYYLMGQNDYDWWVEYIDEYESDQAEINSLSESLAEKHGWEKANEIMEQFHQALDPHTFDDGHKIKQETLKAFREKHGITEP